MKRTEHRHNDAFKKGTTSADATFVAQRARVSLGR
jgi:hypothetical protein